MAADGASPRLTMGVILGLLVGISCSVSAPELPRPGTCDPFQLTAVSPAPDSEGIPPDVVPTLTFSDFPNPDTVDGSTRGLFTGFFYHTGRYWVDLVGRRAYFRPSGSLTLGLGYTLAVRPGIRSLRGCALERDIPPAIPSGGDALAIRFRVVAPGAARLPIPVPAPAATYEQVVGIFAAHCTGGACHLTGAESPPEAGGCMTAPAGGLSLCEQDARQALVGVPSRQVNRLVLVTPGDSSRSYLLRKIIGAPPVVGHVGVPDDSLSQDDQRAIEDWIDRGALPAQTNDGGL